MLYILNRPSTLSAVYNPIQFQLKVTGGGGGAKAVGVIDVTGTVTAGDSITFDGQTYYASDDPVYGEFYTSAVATAAQIAASIKYAIEEDPNINYKWDVGTIVGAAFQISSKKKGAKWNVGLTTTSVGITCIPTPSLTSGADEYASDSLDNFGVWLDIYVNSSVGGGGFFGSSISYSTNTEKVIRIHQKYNNDNRYTFDIQGILKNYVNYQTPDLSFYFVYRDDFKKTFKIDYGTEYSSDSNNYVRKYYEGTLSNFWIINSAFDIDESFTMSDYYGSSSFKLLTNQPSTKRTIDGQREWLYFFSNHAFPVTGYELGIIAKYYFTDGTDTGNIYKFNQKLWSDGVYQVRTDVNAVDVAGIEILYGKTVESYDITIGKTAGISSVLIPISETQTYEIYKQCPEFYRNFAFINKLGGTDSFVSQGITEYQYSVNRTTYESTYNRNFNTAGGLTNNLSSSAQQIYTTNSGWLSEEEMIWLKEMLISPKIWSVENDEFKTINITGHEWSYNDQTKLYSLKVSWKYGWSENKITN